MHGVPIRRWQPGDAAALDALYGDVFGAEARDAFVRRRRWQYLDNPWVAQPALFVAAAGDRLVGQTGGLPVPLRLEGAPVAAAWGADTMVHPAWRRRGIAAALVEAWADAGDHALGLGLGPAPAQHALLVGRGYRVVGAVTGLAGAIDGPAGPQGVEVAGLDLADPAIDALWERVAPAYGALVARDGAWLRWRYAAAPWPRYAVFGARRDGALVGWSAMRLTPRMGSTALLVDWLCAPDDGEVLDALVAHLRAWGRARGAAAVFAFASEARAVARLIAAGLRALPEFATPLLVGGSQAAMASASIERWHLTLGDSDKDRGP